MLPTWFDWCIKHFGKIILALYIAMTVMLCVDAKHNYDSVAGQVPMTATVNK